MSGTTVRIRDETREALRELERQTGQGPQDLLARAVDQFRRSLILAETNVAYGRLRAEAPDELGAELRELDGALADGLDGID
jgi:predicted transcriptional regulator